MNFELTQLVFAGTIICLAALAQSAVGFGFALFATPLLLLLGIPLPDTIIMVATCSALQATIAARQLRASIPWSLALNATAVRLISVIIGLFFLKYLVTFSPDYIKATISGILCLLAIMQLLWRPRPVESMHRGWGILAWSASGLLSGICGMGGPPLILWTMAHNWSTKKNRGFLFAVFSTSIPFQLALLCVMFGVDMLWNIVIGTAFLPLVYLGLKIGMPIGNRMSKTTLRRVALFILLVIGTVAITQTFI